MPDAKTETVVITGAGSGIGQALALAFARRGTHVVAVGRSRQGIEETRERCIGPGSLETRLLDVSDAAALEQLFLEIVQRRGQIDLLVNGAAVYPHTRLEDMLPEDWTTAVATNLNSVAFACRAAIRTFPKDRLAVILNVGSFAHLAPGVGDTLYCSTKAALPALTRALAVELRASNSPLIVNEWIPGIYRTRMSGQTGEDPTVAFDRLLAVWEQSKSGPGGRTFLQAAEVLPVRSLRSRLIALLRGGRR